MLWNQPAVLATRLLTNEAMTSLQELIGYSWNCSNWRFMWTHPVTWIRLPFDTFLLGCPQTKILMICPSPLNSIQRYCWDVGYKALFSWPGERCLLSKPSILFMVSRPSAAMVSWIDGPLTVVRKISLNFLSSFHKLSLLAHSVGKQVHFGSNLWVMSSKPISEITDYILINQKVTLAKPGRNWHFQKKWWWWLSGPATHLSSKLAHLLSSGAHLSC